MISINSNCQVGRQVELKNIHCNKYYDLQLNITTKITKSRIAIESMSRRYNFYSCRNPFKYLQLQLSYIMPCYISIVSDNMHEIDFFLKRKDVVMKINYFQLLRSVMLIAIYYSCYLPKKGKFVPNIEWNLFQMMKLVHNPAFKPWKLVPKRLEMHL